ncbi:acyltransferase family protein [Mycolicibacterium hodleri]|uniref:Acyltransferase n=1 Tax=Mycolicibacterium hodleri TaxID=49897 RepID=A0A502EFP9_9MYCO|nr:acyltransferase [Mycolicibacterium hodleri]TPG36044.1 acyltransferase [Mycolicibacterium hodleri]
MTATDSSGRASGRVASLTGIRAVAAILVMLTHAAYTTGKYTHGYVGLIYSRLEIGVPIFFVLSGFLLFAPWVRAAARTDGQRPYVPPSLSRYAWHRVRRIMPAYVITVLAAYLLYHFRTAGPNPGHTWMGLFRNLTLTQIYTDDYLFSYLHQGLTQMWSLAVEAAFYVALPILAYLLVVVLCRRQWHPVRLVLGLVVLAAISPGWLVLVHATDFLPDGAPLWLPTYLMWFIGGMLLAALLPLGVKAYATVCVPLALACYFIAATPIAGAPTTSPAELREGLIKTLFYAVISTLMVAPLALRGRDGGRGWYQQFMASRPMVFLGEISYEIFLIHLVTMELVMVEILRFPIYTGSMFWLFVVTLVVTVPLAWLLHRVTRVRT